MATQSSITGGSSAVVVDQESLAGAWDSWTEGLSFAAAALRLANGFLFPSGEATPCCVRVTLRMRWRSTRAPPVSSRTKGPTLKAVAVFRQVGELVRKHELTDNALDEDARAALPGLYRALGLRAEADDVEREPTRPPRSMH
jgi:hypothetical protein